MAEAEERDTATLLYPEPPAVEEDVAAAVEPPAEPESTPSIDPSDDGVASETEAVAEDGGIEGEPAAEAAPADTDTASDDDVITAWSDVVEHMQWDREWADSILTFDVTVDGRTSTVHLPELIASYQIQEAAQKRLTDAKAIAADTDTKAKAAATQIGEQLTQAGALILAAEKIFDFGGSMEALTELRDTDPAQYIIRRDQLTEQRNAIEAIKQQARALHQASLAELNTAPDHDQFLRDAQAELHALIPEWRGDDAVADKNATIEYLKERVGFTDEDVRWASGDADAEMPDTTKLLARFWLMARDGRNGHVASSNVASARERVKTIPKVMRPGAETAGQRKTTPRDAADVLYGKKQ